MGDVSVGERGDFARARERRRRRFRVARRVVSETGNLRGRGHREPAERLDVHHVSVRGDGRCGPDELRGGVPRLRAAEQQQALTDGLRRGQGGVLAVPLVRRPRTDVWSDGCHHDHLRRVRHRAVPRRARRRVRFAPLLRVLVHHVHALTGLLLRERVLRLRRFGRREDVFRARLRLRGDGRAGDQGPERRHEDRQRRAEQTFTADHPALLLRQGSVRHRAEQAQRRALGV
mmetsp:Transcript_10580/g.45038  ORF Transcript_10580/g.45038 Transcript_10580/m.45038 type:complete len:231 (-) Transcript_10580:1840-2532(-)